MLHENIRSNVHLINNKTVELKEVTLIFSTLWTNISPARQWQVEHGMSDFRVIKYEGNLFTANEYNRLHAECMFFLKESLTNSVSGKRVVVSHHVPTEFHYPEKYKGSPICEGFVVELFSLIEESGPDVWIYGHHHSNVPDFRIGNTDLTTNQLGYVRHKEHLDYEPFKYIIY